VIPVSLALGFPRYRASVKWPDGEKCEVQVDAPTPEDAERWCFDVWGASITVRVTPLVDRP
jgi:hypothetical protein